MQFKLDKTQFPVLKDTNEIPDNFKQLFQDGYERRYLDGPFGHILMQTKEVGIFKLSLYYVEVINAFEFHVIEPSDFVTFFCPVECSPRIIFNNRQNDHVFEKPKLIRFPAAPYQHYIEVNPPFYCSWHITTDFEHLHLWEQNGFVQDIAKRFQPKLNFTRNPVQIVRMPLAK